jgi:RNA polymerase sigma-70 factor (ECF subfamily)
MSATVSKPALRLVQEEDVDLVARAIGGDERAFAQVYRRYAKYVAGVVFRLMGDEGELDDVVQETFVDAHAGLASLRDPGGVKGWLVTIAVRKVARRLERKRRQRFFLGLFGGGAPRAASPEIESDVYGLYERLAAISAERRIPWSLHTIEGMTLPEVADHCGVSLATVKRRIHEAEALMRQRGGTDGR